jgi:phage portal protein BeeE
VPRTAPRIEAAGTVALTAPSPSALLGWGTGAERLAPFSWAPPTAGIYDRSAAMSVPTVSRARDLLCSTVAALPFRLWRLDRFRDPAEQVAPAGWMDRPDPNLPRQILLAWTVDDLLFYGAAYWRITRRYADSEGGYPATFVRMPFTQVTVEEGQIRWRNTAVPAADVVAFWSPMDGLLFNGARAISIALQLDTAAERFAGVEIPAGWLQQSGGEPLSADGLSALADGFTARRRANAIAALSETITYHESTMDPSRLQLTEGRDHQALELARLANIPPYLVGAPSGSSFTYQNAQQARADLIDFGAMPYLTCLEQTLSGPNVTPSTQAVRMDVETWLRTSAGDTASPPSPTAEVPQ